MTKVTKFTRSFCFILASVETVEGINNSLESLCLSMTEHALAGMEKLNTLR